MQGASVKWATEAGQEETAGSRRRSKKPAQRFGEQELPLGALAWWPHEFAFNMA